MLFLLLLFFVLFVSFVLLVLLMLLTHLPLTPVLGPAWHQVISLNLLDNLFHLDWIANNRIPSFLFLTLDLEHRVFIQEGKILALVVGDFFLEDVFKFFSCVGIGFLLTGEELLVGFLLLKFVTPVVHPLHAVHM